MILQCCLSLLHGKALLDALLPYPRGTLQDKLWGFCRAVGEETDCWQHSHQNGQICGVKESPGTEQGEMPSITACVFS